MVTHCVCGESIFRRSGCAHTSSSDWFSVADAAASSPFSSTCSAFVASSFGASAFRASPEISKSSTLRARSATDARGVTRRKSMETAVVGTNTISDDRRPMTRRRANESIDTSLSSNW